MGYRVCQQPNGLFCLFSSIVDDFTIYDASQSEMLLHCQKEFGNRVGMQMMHEGANPTFFAIALNDIAIVHGHFHASNWRDKLSSVYGMVTQEMMDRFTSDCDLLDGDPKMVFATAVRVWNECR
jgi:hypothetical protein